MASLLGVSFLSPLRRMRCEVRHDVVTRARDAQQNAETRLRSRFRTSQASQSHRSTERPACPQAPAATLRLAYWGRVQWFTSTARVCSQLLGGRIRPGIPCYSGLADAPRVQRRRSVNEGLHRKTLFTEENQEVKTRATAHADLSSEVTQQTRETASHRDLPFAGPVTLNQRVTGCKPTARTKNAAPQSCMR
jgi:hypothetical protein